MTIRVLMFGALAQQCQVRELKLSLADGGSVTAALDVLAQQYSQVNWLQPQGRAALGYAVNMEYVSAAQGLREGDELALIPPVSGG